MRALTAVVLTLLLAALPGAALAQVSFTWEADDQAAVADLLVLTIFHSYVVNTGATTANYHVTMTVEAPPVWVTSMCEGDFCYAPFVREFDFALDPGDTNDVGANITPVTDRGRALVAITVTSIEDPAQSITHSFSVVTPGLDVLVVDDDPFGDPVPLTAAAVGALGKSSVAWAATEVGAPDAAELSHFGTVLWATGISATGLGDGARAALDTYVQQGGHLWLAGANLAFSQCSPGSPVYSPASLAWFNDVAGVDWVAFSAASTAVSGVPGDELGDGLALTLGGGDSANNNTSPDVIAAAGGGVACLTYGSGGTAGVRRVWGAGRIVTTGFTLEGVETGTQRADLAAAILGWYTGGASAVQDLPAVLVGRPQVVPNPFNPRTSIVFTVGGAADRHVAVAVHDLRGRLVRRLFDGPLAPGRQAVGWDGRDDAGRSLGAGLYLARITAGDERMTAKMTLAK